jgi:hypothetical protein
MRKVSDKSFKEKTHILYSVFFSPENPAVYDTMWKNTLETDSLQMLI